MKNRIDEVDLEVLCSGVKDKQVSGVEKCKYITAYKKISCKVLIQNHCYFNIKFDSEKVILYK